MASSASSFPSLPPDSVVAPCPAAKQPQVHWIEIELVAEDGSPIPWEMYTIAIPGRPPENGLLDEQGFARIEQIEKAGDCQVSFPNLDRAAVRFLEELPAKAAPTGPDGG